jgi:epoxyqueuosine reductase QueG
MNIKQKQNMKAELYDLALLQGFDDARFVYFENKHYILLFKQFDTGKVNTQKESVAASLYYAASNATDQAVINLAEILPKKYGIKTKVASDDVHVKSLAIASGGLMGLNSLYYHEQYGSIVSMQALRIDADLSDNKPVNIGKCRMCLRCVDACPMQAISEDGFDRSKCLREMMDYEIPSQFRHKLYQLFSCERCQRCCPENPEQTQTPVTFDIKSILQEKLTDQIIDYCGTYVGTRDRILRETILIASRNNLSAVIPELKKLQNDEDTRISKYAKWALEQIK